MDLLNRQGMVMLPREQEEGLPAGAGPWQRGREGGLV